ncbi:helix-turn-helix domain-containing protein [Winogradskyella haliclonae]|uniref:HTH cro/C1-type domain-containing protein n=1 Tax=Winogradskyella haliclonae TaxID=2048558 RepID=A0ABQ2C0S2_9FLAO|nr:helix-turn-helix domain-containing protein [Winogradskyella haliclonae]GGI57667.1 hypothetical protein GCM10011444_19760 [Winogradskyella haliclonae]
MKIIKNIREKSGYTQVELAKQTGLSLRTIQRLESSNKEPKGYTLMVLSKKFNMEPSALSAQFKIIESEHESEKTSIQLINLSIISFIGIPFGNIIFPIILWYRNRKSKFVDEIGRRIINFQIIWWIVLSLLLCLSPIISRKFLSNTQIILYVLFACYVFNIVIVCITAIKLKRNDYSFLNVPISFI